MALDGEDMDQIEELSRSISGAREESSRRNHEIELRILENELALLGNTIRERKATIPGYSRELNNFIKLIASFKKALDTEIRNKYPSIDRHSFSMRFNELYEPGINKIDKHVFKIATTGGN